MTKVIVMFSVLFMVLGGTDITDIDDYAHDVSVYDLVRS